MELIVAEIVKIIKSENNIIKRERKIVLFFLDWFRELMSLALAEIDDHLVNELKSCGYAIEKKNQRSINMSLGEVRYSRRRYTAPGKKPRYPLDELMGFDKYQRYSLLAVRNVLEVSSVATYRNTALAVNCLSGFNVSHAQVGKLIKQAGREIKAKQESDSRYDQVQDKKYVSALYLEGE